MTMRTTMPIRATRPLTSECLNSGFLHTAEVVELLKDAPAQPVRTTVAFVQEQWVEERTPYRIGQAMVIFLSARKELSRAFGPFGVFFIDGDRVTSWHAYMKTDGTSASGFLAQLRTFGKEIASPHIGR